MKLNTLKKGPMFLSLCLITALSLVSCASHDSQRSPADEKQDKFTKDESNTPHEFHGKRFERNNKY